jgi:hypothetical protein
VGDRLRLFHFHAFDTSRPDELSTRLASSTVHLRTEGTAVDALCREYAETLLRHEQALGPAAPYPYWTDTHGRTLSRHLRRAYRIQSADLPDGAAPLPSPFLPADAEAFDSWRRRALKTEAKELAGDVMKSARLAFPDEYGRLRSKFPRVADAVRGKVFRGGGIWK